jgi:natural product biosynthesis luciferase-like monooxygenase protein
MSPAAFLQQPIRWLQAISRCKATISGGPDFAYELCVRKIKPEQRKSLDLSSWSVAFNGSEPVREETLENFAAAFEVSGFSRSSFFPCYGLAEATLIVSGGPKGRGHVVRKARARSLGMNEVVNPAADEASRSVVSSGVVLPGQRVAIVDTETLTQCPPDQIGEVWIAGESVAQGYWNRGEETEERFHARLADADMGEGPFLRTGDLGFLKDERLFITGRLKDLIIIRGLNHYPQDIEATVQQSHPALTPGCGAAFPIDVDGEERLAVVQEVNPRKHPDYATVLEKIRRAIAEEHELLAHSILLVKPGTVPKTSSGKLQRHASRNIFLEGGFEPVGLWQAPASGPYAGEALAVTAETPEAIQGWLVSQVAALTGIDVADVDADRPIIQYGIDSLMSIQLAHEIESSFNVMLSMSSLLEDSSIIGLANRIWLQLTGGADQIRSLDGLKAEVDEGPPSRGQQALWFLHRLNPESPAYNLAVAVRIRTHLDVPALLRAFEMLTERHPMLRTTFSAPNGEPIQRIHNHVELSFRHEDVSDNPEEFLCRRLTEEAHRPFDIENGPTMRVVLFTQSEQDHTLILVIHHIVADFWSLSVLMKEMSLLYSAARDGTPAALPPLRLQYSDYVRWQDAVLAAPEGERLWNFWQDRLSGRPQPLNLLTDRPRPPVQTFCGASSPFRIDGELTRELRALSRRRGATLYMTLLAAFQVLLYRYCGQEDFLIGSPGVGRNRADLAPLVGYFVNPLVMRADLSGDPAFEEFLDGTRRSVLAALDHQDYPFALLVERLEPERDLSRSPLFQVMFTLQKSNMLDEGLACFALGEAGARLQIGELPIESVALQQRIAQFDLTLIMAEAGAELGASLQYNTDLFNAETINRMAEQFQTLLESIAADSQCRLSQLDLLTRSQRQQILIDWNDTQREYPQEACVHDLFETQAEQYPDAISVVLGAEHLSYRQLNERANQLANHLRSLGVGPERRVGICMGRSLEMIVAMLGILKAGGAYVPMDTTLPRDRLKFILDDAGIEWIVTRGGDVNRLEAESANIIRLDRDWHSIACSNAGRAARAAEPDNLAYLIYTSGSTGRPKGVMISHRSVVNFFMGVDDRIGCGRGETLMAVTSISFDISVLELLWPLIRGGRVLLLDERAVIGLASQTRSARAEKEMRFSLFYFASDDSPGDAGDKYRLLIEGAKFADLHDFAAVWTPERHFHAFGGLYPNPSVMSAALSMITSRIQIRAGSVVMPLHHPVRVAEEWALVDNLSKGRIGVAFASGWHANDFVFFPENYKERKEVMLRGIEAVQKLWRGEGIIVPSGAGNDIEVKIYPKPIQRQLPIWLTAAGASDTFVKAGEMGANILTHLLGQSVEDVAEKIKAYREGLAKHGYDPRSRQVVVMLHTLIGEDKEAVREKVREPFTNYLRSSVGLIGNLIKSLNMPLDLDTMSSRDMDDLLSFAFARYFETSALFGTPTSCLAMIDRLKEIDVDEVACLVDFGIDSASALASLEHLAVLKDRANSREQLDDYSLPAQAQRYKPTLMQCTPSMMGMLSLNREAVASLESLRILMLGGEAIPAALAREVKEVLPARLMNMYGPTETTIWSAVREVKESASTVAIGGPIANTRIYILDGHLHPVPVGVMGELYIGGQGVARGYHDRPGLTAEKFTPDTFCNEPGARLYKTGDLAAFLPDGTIKFFGRADYQVKIRGFRIELEEIEAALAQYDGVREVAVAAHEDADGGKRLVAYIVPNSEQQCTAIGLRSDLRDRLPDYMLPSVFIMLDALPLTPNGKVDRKSLPAPEGVRPRLQAEYTAPRSRLERSIVAIWQKALKVETVGIHDNFFDLGGHSLLMAQVHSQICHLLKRDIPLIKMLEHPTVSSLSHYLSRGRVEPLSIQPNYERAEKQREGLMRQRRNIRTRLKT